MSYHFYVQTLIELPEAGDWRYLTFPNARISRLPYSIYAIENISFDQWNGTILMLLLTITKTYDFQQKGPEELAQHSDFAEFYKNTLE